MFCWLFSYSSVAVAVDAEHEEKVSDDDDAHGRLEQLHLGA